MSKEFESRLRDWAVFFHENKDRGRDYDREMAFLKVSLDGCLELLAIAAQDIQNLEGKPRSSPLLWTPNGMTRRGD